MRIVSPNSDTLAKNEDRGLQKKENPHFPDRERVNRIILECMMKRKKHG